MQNAMISILLMSFPIKIACNYDLFVEDYVEKNLGSIATKENLAGYGCSANVYGFRLQNQDLIVKKFHDMRRCQKEVSFLKQISEYSLPVIPRVYVKDAEKHIVVMDRMDENLGSYLAKHIEDKDIMRKIVNDIFNGLAMFYERGIVHGDLHTDNIMIRSGNIFFIDFGDSFFSRDFSLDLLRLRYRVLSKVRGWEALIDRDTLRNPKAFSIIEKIYKDPSISRLFRLANLFNAPMMQYITYRMLSFTTKLNSLISEYSNSMPPSPSSDVRRAKNTEKYL